MGGREIGPDTTLVVNGSPMQVVGVTPPAFFGLAVGERFDVAFPFCRPNELRRDVFSITVMGRLRPGWTPERASAQLHAASPGILEATSPTGYTANTVAAYKRWSARSSSSAAFAT